MARNVYAADEWVVAGLGGVKGGVVYTGATVKRSSCTQIRVKGFTQFQEKPKRLLRVAR
jgi:hypothetical protein